MPAQARQPVRELLHRLELLAVAALSPEVVIAVLLASGRVHAGGLDVTKRVGADPDVLPGRRDAQLANALEHAGLRDRSPVLVEIREAPAATTSGYARR